MPELNAKNLKYAKLIEQYSKYIDSPVQRLKFLNNAFNQEPPRRSLILPIIGALPERARLVVELSKVLPPNKPAPLAVRLTSLAYRLRFLVYAMSALLVISGGAGVIYVGYQLITAITTSTEAKDLAPAPSAVIAANNGEAVAAIGSEAGLTLDKVWLAEQGEGYEFYSNGARVLTEFQTDGPARLFYSFDLAGLPNGSDGGETGSQPIGIVYHVSESDILPFDDKFNRSLQVNSRGLLEYARLHRLYNYVIDRFGRVYRIVPDESMASHAGNSVWSDGQKVWISLSHSFIGICFEGNSGEGQTVGADGINEAQIYAARVLTAVLRSRYGISDANCVTHGLVSVNPSNRLMGFHTDWVAGFPFEAVGLSNKYETELVAVSRLGFGYDRAYLARAGGASWPGLDRADSVLRENARGNGLSVDAARRGLYTGFQRAYVKQQSLEK
jgi:hypothetical protein